MYLDEFKKLYPKFSKVPVAKISDLKSGEDLTNEEIFFFAWQLNNDKVCLKWYVKQRLKDLGHEGRAFCCSDMGKWMIESIKCENKGNHNRNNEWFALYWHDLDAYGLRHPSRRFTVPINYCPWCGKKLPKYVWPSGRKKRKTNK